MTVDTTVECLSLKGVKTAREKKIDTVSKKKMKEEEKCDPRDKRSLTLHPFTTVSCTVIFIFVCASVTTCVRRYSLLCHDSHVTRL